MGVLPGVGQSGYSLPAVELSYISSTPFTANASTYSGTFTLTETSDVLLTALGEPSAGFGAINAFSINSVGRTQLINQDIDGAFALGVPSGSIPFSVTWATGRSRGVVHAFRVRNLISPTLVDSHSVFVSGLTTPMILDVPDGGGMVTLVYKGGYGGDIVWNVGTEVYDVQIEATSKHSAIFYNNNYTGLEVNKAVTPSYSSASANAALGLAISFR